MKITIRNNITDLPYSLHDAVVTGIEFAGDRVIFFLQKDFSSHARAIAGELTAVWSLRVSITISAMPMC